MCDVQCLQLGHGGHSIRDDAYRTKVLEQHRSACSGPRLALSFVAPSGIAATLPLGNPALSFGDLLVTALAVAQAILTHWEVALGDLLYRGFVARSDGAGDDVQLGQALWQCLLF